MTDVAHTTRRALLLSGVAGGAAAATGVGGRAAASPKATDEPNPEVREEEAHVRLLRTQLNAAAADDDRFELDDSGRRIVVAKQRTHVLKRPLVIGGNTRLVARGATFQADFALKPTTFDADRQYYHSPTPTYPDVIETFASTVGSTMVLNHVPSEETGLYSAPGNIRLEGGTWDPTGWFLRNETGEELQRATAAPAMNAITFTHTHDIEVVGVTVRNVKWWHGVEFNAVRTATVSDSRFEGWIENPTSGLWNCDAVQVDLPQPHTKWAGAADHTPAIDIRIRDNWFGASDSHPAWGSLGCSHSTSAGKVFSHIWIERNTMEDLIWDGILPMNADHLVIRENTITNCRGGVYVKAFANPLSTVDVVGNTISIIPDSDRPAIGIVGTGEDTRISDVAVYGNLVENGEFWYTLADFRREPQQQ